MGTTTTKPFDFYLDAWIFCVKSGIPLTKIRKVSFRTWAVEINT